MSAPLRGRGGPPRRHGLRVVAVSPHLDDAVFSAGGTLARLADAGADVTVVTCFTGSVPPADCSPFALSTQLDKGLSADVDYMALRRVEDDDARAALGGLTGEHLPLLEAPHRGYTSAPDLFAGRHPDDDVAGPLAAALRPWVDADLVLAPQAVGDHVDHQVVTAVVASLVDPDAVAWWRDTPYAVRHPDAAGLPEARGTDVAVDVAAALDRKVAATRSYRTQVGFQFGGDDEVAPALAALARAEGDRAGVPGPVEILRCGNRANEILGSLSGAAAGD